MTEPLKFSPTVSFAASDHQIHSHAGRDKQKSMRFFIVIKAKDSDRGSQLITLAAVQWPLGFLNKIFILWISYEFLSFISIFFKHLQLG